MQRYAAASRQADACRFLRIAAYGTDGITALVRGVSAEPHTQRLLRSRTIVCNMSGQQKGFFLCLFRVVACFSRFDAGADGWCAAGILQFTSGTGAKTTTERCRYLRTSRMRQIQGQHMWLRVVMYRVCSVCVDRCMDKVCVSLPLPPSPFPLLIPHPLPSCSLLLPPPPSPSLSARSYG
jgi:hypothetical protein